MPDFLTERDVAAKLNVSRFTLRTWRARGEGPPAITLASRTVRYPRELLERWLASRTPKAA